MTTRLLTIAEARDRMPEVNGYRPSERWLREAVIEMGLAVRCGKAVYLDPDDWPAFVRGLKGWRSRTRSPIRNARS